jgi:molybdopterin molybdotransferase
MGFEILVHGVCLKPGKPVLIGLQGRKVAIGIPGNPVSHFVVFHLFIRRLLDAMAGKRPVELVEARLEAGAPLGFEKRETFWPARCVLRSGCLVATPLAWVDSGDVAGLRGVNALLRLPAGEPPPVEGARVRLAPCGKLW